MRSLLWKLRLFWLLMGLVGVLVILAAAVLAVVPSYVWAAGPAASWGFLIAFLGFGLTFGSASERGRDVVWKLRIVSYLGLFLGIILLLLSTVVHLDYWSFGFDPRTLMGKISWDYLFILGSFFFGGALLFASAGMPEEWRETLWRLKFFSLTGVLLGIVLILLSFGAYSTYLAPGLPFELSRTIGGTISWDFLFPLGALLLFSSILLFVMGVTEDFRDSIGRVWPVWMLVMLVGFVVMVVGLPAYKSLYSSVHLDVLPGTGGGQTLLGVDWSVFVLTGTLIFAIGWWLLLSFFGARGHRRMHKLRIIWFLLILLGLISVGLSAVALARYQDGQALLTIGWQVYLFFGSAVCVFAIMPVIIASRYECTHQVEDVEGMFAEMPAGESAETRAEASEFLAYLNISQKITLEGIGLVSDAYRRKKVGDSLYRRVTSSLRRQLDQIEEKKKTVLAAATRQDLRSIFEDVIGKDEGLPSSASPVARPTPGPAAPSTPSPAAPSPLPRPSPASAGPPSGPPSGPPPGPPSGPSPLPSPFPPREAARPPSAPPSIGAPVPAARPTAPPVGPLASPGERPPLDLVGDARSTSIAELRGEMLKELRRLREIFKEE